MPFRLVNVPATFERLMERVLRGIAWSECLVYLDNILVFGPDFATTLKRLQRVLDRLGTPGLKLIAKKCPRQGSELTLSFALAEQGFCWSGMRAL